MLGRPEKPVEAMIEVAVEGLTITPEQLHAELVGDLPDLAAGELTEDALRLCAETLSVHYFLATTDPREESNED